LLDVLHVVDVLRKHFKQFLPLLYVNCFDDKLPILGEEKETTTLASSLVLLTLVGFENLEPVALGIQRLVDVDFVNIVDVPDELEHLWSVRNKLDVDVDLLEFGNPSDYSPFLGLPYRLSKVLLGLHNILGFKQGIDASQLCTLPNLVVVGVHLVLEFVHCLD
jgi:hypothetical protein